MQGESLQSLPCKAKNTKIPKAVLRKCFGVGNNLFELRVRGQQEIRIFYTFYDDKAILLHVFIKKTQKTPAREIEIAINKFKQLTII